MSEISTRFSGLKILAKIHQLMAAVTYLQKTEENKEQRYKYLSAEAVSERIQPELIKLQLVPLPMFETIAESEYSTKSGAIWKYNRTRLNLLIVDIESGEYCQAVGEGSGTDPGDKAVAKAQTMADKNLWCKLLKVPIGDDPEADPVTDQQQFFPVHAAPAAPTIPVYGFPAYEREIVDVWTRAGWPQGGIHGWVQQRFQRPPAQLTPEECYAILNEFVSYVNQKTGGQ